MLEEDPVQKQLRQAKEMAAEAVARREAEFNAHMSVARHAQEEAEAKRAAGRPKDEMGGVYGRFIYKMNHTYGRPMDAKGYYVTFDRRNPDAGSPWASYLNMITRLRRSGLIVDAEGDEGLFWHKQYLSETGRQP